MKHKKTTLGIIIVLLLAWWMSPSLTWSSPCDDLGNATLSDTVNSYYPGIGTANSGATSITVGPAATGGVVTAPVVGDMLLVIQMQDADIAFPNTNSYGDGAGSDPANGWTGLNSSGFFEYVVATAVASAGPNWVVTIVGGAGNGLLHSYRTAAETSTTGQRTFQVVRIPRYNKATLLSSLTAAPWNGSTGGILGIDACKIDLAGAAVSVDGKGFRGGGAMRWGGDATMTATNTDFRFWATDNWGGPDEYPDSSGAHGLKGEGIAGTPRFVWDGTQVFNPGPRVIGYPQGSAGVDGSTAMGAPGNAGGGGTDGHPLYAVEGGYVKGNDENSGGGGGGNGGVGGYGGRCWLNPTCTGRGNPGAAFTWPPGPGPRMSMGGGGGAGTRNNQPINLDYQYTASSGGLGGGIVLFRTCTVTGNGSITANGTGKGDPRIEPLWDGSGGGGAGGTIVVVAQKSSDWSGLTVLARGGGGVNNSQSTFCPNVEPYDYCRHGPGGGGGGGVVWLSGSPGAQQCGRRSTRNHDPDPNLDDYGSTDGDNGTISNEVGFDYLPGVQFSCEATWARIGGVRVDPKGVIEFATTSQLGSRAFNIYETWDPKGRGERTLLTDEAIPAAPLAVMEPVLYRASTRPLKAPYILIEEIECGGGPT